MNENINLCKILKDCPKGTKFYSPLFGELSFSEILLSNELPIRLLDSNNREVGFFTNGKYMRINTECLLFPSKDQRDWSKFKCSKPKFDPNTLQPFDQVLVKVDKNPCKWKCGIFSNVVNVVNEVYKYKVECIGSYYKYCIPYNDDTKHLVGTSDEAPEYYRYWEE